MNLLLVVIGFFLFLILWGSVKHRLHLRIKHTLFILVLVFVALIMLSSYVDISYILGKDSLLSKTGAAVMTDVKSNIYENPLIKESTLKSVKQGAALKMQELSDGVVRLSSVSLVSSKGN